jgi:hypothetical protein
MLPTEGHLMSKIDEIGHHIGSPPRDHISCQLNRTALTAKASKVTPAERIGQVAHLTDRPGARDRRGQQRAVFLAFHCPDVAANVLTSRTADEDA